MYNLEDVAKGMSWAFMIFPHFALSNSLNNYNFITTFTRLCSLRNEFCPGCSDEQLCEWYPECCCKSMEKLYIYCWIKYLTLRYSSGIVRMGCAGHWTKSRLYVSRWWSESDRSYAH